MSTPTIARTISARWLHSSIAIGSMLVFVAAIAIVLTLRSAGVTPAPRSILAAVDIHAALDQHERHPAGFTNIYAPLDQHERHPVAQIVR